MREMGGPTWVSSGAFEYAEVGSEDVMAKVIEFYVPERFRTKVKWVPATQRGKVIQFPVDVKKSA